MANPWDKDPIIQQGGPQQSTATENPWDKDPIMEPAKKVETPWEKDKIIEAATEPEDTSSDFVRGLKQYIPQQKEILGGVQVLAGKALGSDEQIKKGLDRIQGAQQEQEVLAKQSDSFTNALDKGVMTVVTDWLPYVAGQGAGMIGEALLTSIAGGAVGSMFGPGGTGTGIVTGLVSKNLVKKGLKEQVEKIAKEQGEEVAQQFIEKEAKDFLASEAGRQAVKQEFKKYGSRTALAGMAGKYGYGEVTSRAATEAIKDIESTEDQIKAIDAISTPKLVALGTGHAGLNYLGQAIGLKALEGLSKPTRSFLRNAATNIIAAGTREAPVEALQSLLERYGADLPLADRQAIQEYIDASAAGFAMPAVPGAIGSVRATVNERARLRDEAIQTKIGKDTDTEKVSTEARKDRLNSLIEEGKQRQQKQNAKEVLDNPISILDEVALKKLGINKRSIAHKTLLGVDLSTEEGVEIFNNVMEEYKGKPNIQAIENLQKTLQEPNLEGNVQEKLENARKTKSKRTARGDELPLPRRISAQPTDTPKPKTVNGAPVVSSRANSGKPVRGKGKLGSPLTVNQGKKASIAFNDNGRFRQAEGVVKVIDGRKFLESEIVDPKGITPPVKQQIALNENQILNPTKEQISILKAEAKQTKQQLAQEKTAQETQQTQDEIVTDDAGNRYRKVVTINEAGAREVGYEKLNDGETVVNPEQDIDGETKASEGKTDIAQAKQVTEVTKTAKSLGQALNNIKQKLSKSLTEPQKQLIDILNRIQSVNQAKFSKATGLNTTHNGRFSPITNSVEITDTADVNTVLHEGVHAATVYEMRKHISMDGTKAKTKLGQEILDMFEAAKGDENQYGLTDVYEFIAEAFSNPQFQVYLSEKPSIDTGKTSRLRSLWDDFVDAVARLLKIPAANDTLLGDVLALAPDLFKGGPGDFFTRKDSDMPDSFFQRMTPNRKKILKDNLKKTGHNPKEPNSDSNLFGETETDLVPRSDKIANAVFSFDAALNNAIRNYLEKSKKSWEDIQKALYKITVSQALHAEELANRFLDFGKIIFEPETYKFKVVQGDVSFTQVRNMLKDIAKNQGLSLEELEVMATQAFVAKREEQLAKQQQALDDRVIDLVAQGKDAEARKIYRDENVVLQMTPAQRKAALAYLTKGNQAYIPGLDEVYESWLEVRNNVLDVMVENGTLSDKQRERFLEIMDYVPFYRVEQIEKGNGPREWANGLLDTAKTPRIRGSFQPVNNVFDNMQRWIRREVRRSVLNKVAQEKIEVTQEYLPGIVEEVNSNAKGENMVDIWQNGTLTRYQFADPYYAKAFTGLENVLLPGIKYLSDIANILRANVVLYPLFSIAQLPKDAYDAMFSSGVSNPFMIPLRVLKEFPLTLINMSKTHSELKKYGAVGGYGSYMQSAMEADVELSKPGLYNRIRRAARKLPEPANPLWYLNRIAMASDNAIRQAIYEQTMAETNDKALAMERAFEVINFRRAGSNPAITLLRQTVPFFGAFLQAASVQGRVLAGRSIAPVERAQALQAFRNTLALSIIGNLIYRMLLEDDEEYDKLDPSIRDAKYIMGNGMMISLRHDIFTFLSKVVPEHIYNYLTGDEDSRKMILSLKNSLVESSQFIAAPQAIRPLVELMTGVEFRTGRPIVSQALEARDIEQQFTASTSELAKMFGDMSGINPIKIDYFLKQYFGYSMGLALMFTDKIIAESYFDRDLPEKSKRDYYASIPGANQFISKEQGNRHTTDYYQLKGEVDAAYNKYKDLEKNSWDRKRVNEIYKENRNLIATKKSLDKLTSELAAMRRKRRQILSAKKDVMSGAEKKRRLDNLYAVERNLLGTMRRLRKQVYDEFE